MYLTDFHLAPSIVEFIVYEFFFLFKKLIFFVFFSESVFALYTSRLGLLKRRLYDYYFFYSLFATVVDNSTVNLSTKHFDETLIRIGKEKKKHLFY